MAALILTVALTAAPDALPLDVWYADWTARIDESGELTPALIDEWRQIDALRVLEHPPEPVAIAPRQSVPRQPLPDRTWGGNVEQWRPLVETYFAPADVAWAMRVMACESGGDPNAKNRHSTASGLMQFLRGTWDSVAIPLGYGSHASGAVFDPAANIHAASVLFYAEGPHHWVCR